MNKITKEGLLREMAVLSVDSKNLQLYVFDEIASTNQWLMDQPEHDGRVVCIANQQSEGRGREGRSWISQGGGVFMSFSYPLDSGMVNFSAISLVMGLVVCRVLKAEGVEGVALKWPNDVLLNGSKLAGVLIEARRSKKQLSLVIGIGLNVALKGGGADMTDFDWSDLSSQGLGLDDRERLIVLILNEGELAIHQYLQDGFISLREEWMQCDAFAGKEVNVISHGEIVLSGVESGVDESGMLQVLSNSEVVKVHSGDVSLRVKS